MSETSRRNFLTKIGLVALTGAVALPTIAEAKVPRSKVGYQPSPRGNRRCANCNFYNRGNKSCKLVKGKFSPNAWCKLWGMSRRMLK